jgi:hypothetical protein
VRCSECGAEAPAMKTVYLRDDEYADEYALCDSCYEGVAPEVWVVPGVVPCFGLCSRCGEWFSVRELTELRQAGWKWDAPSGLCRNCAKGGR